MTIRPQSLNGFVGQKDAIKILNIAVSSANQRDDALPHTIFCGGPGLGKTSLAQAVASDLGVNIQIANGGALAGVKSLLPYLMKLPEQGRKSVLFIDEIHRLPRKVEEFLYPVMEDFKVCLGGASDELDIELESFTLLGATTDPGSLSQPLYDRFKYKVPLSYYDDDEMETIIVNLAEKIYTNIAADGIKRLVACSRGTPRVAVNYTEWIRDYCLAENISTANLNVVNKALELLGVDNSGLTNEDRQYLDKLKQLQKVSGGNPVGLKPLATALCLSEETVQTKIEPYLVRLGMIYRGSRGRSILNTKVK